MTAAIELSSATRGRSLQVGQAAAELSCGVEFWGGVLPTDCGIVPTDMSHGTRYLLDCSLDTFDILQHSTAYRLIQASSRQVKKKKFTLHRPASNGYKQQP
jgi:hypothetical protein